MGVRVAGADETANVAKSWSEHKDNRVAQLKESLRRGEIDNPAGFLHTVKKT